MVNARLAWLCDDGGAVRQVIFQIISFSVYNAHCLLLSLIIIGNGGS